MHHSNTHSTNNNNNNNNNNTSVNHDNFTPVQSQVLRIFEAESGQSDQGTSLQDVISRLPSHSPTDIRRAIEFLSDEGHLYSTVDEEHFKSTQT